MSKATDKFKNDPYVKDYYKKAQENQAIMNGLHDASVPPAPASAPGPAPDGAAMTPAPGTMPDAAAPAPTPNELAQPADGQQ